MQTTDPLSQNNKPHKRSVRAVYGGDGETRTLAPVSRPTPLAGAPRHQLEYISMVINKYSIKKMAERVGFEPTALSSHRFSRPAP